MHALEPFNLTLTHLMPVRLFSHSKVCRVVHSRNTNKASRLDGILHQFLKEFADELPPVLCRLFCPILLSGIYPFPWKHVLY